MAKIHPEEESAALALGSSPNLMGVLGVVKKSFANTIGI